MKYANKELLLDSSNDEISLQTKKSKGYWLISVKHLSTVVSNVHVCEEGNYQPLAPEFLSSPVELRCSSIKSWIS